MSELGQYMIENEPIGQGGMAEVFVARHIKLQAKVAIKVLRKQYLSDQRIRKRFLDEARKMFSMNHPNIVRVIDLIDGPEMLAIVMQYVDGMSLKEHLEVNGKLSDEQVTKIMNQLTDALSYVHELGVIHRDISPANIMLDREGNAILMDFGISKFILSESGVGSTSVTQTGQVIGTPLYMSPEQIEDSSRVGLQTDIYSLGVVLWQSVTGKVPYGADGMSQYNLIKRVVEQPLEKTHTKWDVLIEKATQKEPSNRFSSAQAFKAALGNKRPDGGQKEPKSVVDRDNNNNNKWGGKALVIIVCLLIVPIVYLVINNTKTTIEADQISKSYSKGGSRSNASSHSAKNLMGNFILVKGGNFKMGCTSALSDCDGDEKPVRMVTLSDYYMGETEVTVRQFKQFVDETGYTTDAENDGGSYFWTGSRWEKRFGVDWRFDAVGQRRPTSAYDHPVVHVSWNDATAFARWMTAGASGQYRLPTEAEWEYAARGGSLSRGYQFAGSNNLDEVAWYASNSGGNTRTVKGKKPNELGLYDMSGNVWEFCSDWYSTYPFDNQTNPTGPFSDSRRVDRGGSCFNEPNDCRVSNRSNGKVGFRGYRLGFRLAWTP